MPSKKNQTSLSNALWLKLGRTRWIKRFLRPYMPTIVPFPVHPTFQLFLELKDIRGPSFYILYGGSQAFEHYECDEKRELLTYLPEKGVFLDLGANIGLFSFYIFSKKPSIRIFAFEPNPILFQCLQLTISANQIKTITPIQQGISDTSTHLNLFLDDTDSGGHSLNRNSFSKVKPEPSCISVEVCTLDDLIEKHSLDRIDFIKIDVQEHESNILKGAISMIKKFQPNFLIEFVNSRLTPEYLSSQEFPLKDYQWKPVGLDLPLREIDQLSCYSDEQFRKGILQTNYFFIKKNVKTYSFNH